MHSNKPDKEYLLFPIIILSSGLQYYIIGIFGGNRDFIDFFLSLC